LRQIYQNFVPQKLSPYNVSLVSRPSPAMFLSCILDLSIVLFKWSRKWSRRQPVDKATDILQVQCNSAWQLLLQVY